MSAFNTLYHEDCRTALKKIASESIDLVVTDPPYRIIAGGCTIKETKDECKGIFRRRVVSDGTACSNRWLKKSQYDIPSAVKTGKMFTHNDIRFAEWIPDIYRVLKNGTHFYVMVNDRNVQEMLNVCTENKFKLVNILTWIKQNAVPNKYYMKNVEFVLLFRKGSARNINDMGSKQSITIPNIIGNKLHPTEKPVALMEYFILNSSQKDNVVLDPFMGSGSTGVACVNNDRRFIGIELDDTYYDMSCQRTKHKELVLF